MNYFPVYTDRLILRDFVKSDWNAVQDYASDPEVVRYMEWGPNNEKDTKGYIKEVLRRQRVNPRVDFDLAVVLKRNSELIGACGIYVGDICHREACIGYCFNRYFWGQGYGTEAAQALLSFGFDYLKLHRIYATCDPFNVGSSRVMEKAGMVREGRLREHKWQKGKWRDSYIYSILEDEYDKSRGVH